MKKIKDRTGAAEANLYGRLGLMADTAYQAQRKQQTGLGDTIRSLRTSQGLKSVELAQRSGLDPRTLAAIECGHIQNPSIEKLQKIAESLGISIADLFVQTQASRPEDFYLGEQKGSYVLEFQQDGFKAISYTPMNTSFFIGKVTLAGKTIVEPGKLPAGGHVFLQMILGKLKVTLHHEEINIKEGSHLLLNGRLPHKLHNPLLKECSFLFVSVPSFVGFSTRT